MSDVNYEDAGVEPSEPEEQLEPAAAAEPEEPEPDEHDMWLGPSQDEWRQTQETQQRLLNQFDQLAPILQQFSQPAAPPEPAAQEPVQFDPYDPDTLGTFIQQVTEQAVQRAVQPFAQRDAETQRRQWVDQQMEALPQRVTGLTPKALETLRGVASVAASEQALLDAARSFSAMLEEARSQGIEEFKKTLQNPGHGSTPYEPAAGGSTAAVQGLPPYKSAEDLARSFIERRRAQAVG